MWFIKNKNKTPARQSSSRSTGSPVFSYYNNRPNDQPTSTTPRKVGTKVNINIEHHVRHIPSYLAMILIAGSALYALTLTIEPKVLVGKSGGDSSLVRTQSIYKQSIRQLLEKSLFNRSKLTINTDSIAAKIEHDFPEIQKATVSIPILGRRPIVGLDPAVPTLLLNGKSSSFIVGQDGRALISIGDVAKGSQPNLPTLQDDSSVRLEQGKAALPKEYVEFITTVISQLKAKQITVKSMQLPAVVNELRVSVSDKSYQVKFNLSGDPRLQVGTYLAVRDRLQSQNINPAEYVDVRVPERAYYK